MGDQLLENNIPKSLQKMIRLIRIPKFDTNYIELFSEGDEELFKLETANRYKRIYLKLS